MKIKGAVALLLVTCCMGGVVCRQNKTEETAACTLAVGDAELKVRETYKTTLTRKESEELESYLVGVVAAEMPAAYDLEALKAQAVAARTYALRAMEAGSDYSQIGQAYISVDTMQSRWGKDFDTYYGKISAAVSATKGIIAVYDGKPILAAFCAASCGTTEESSNVWEQSLPYLVSVSSPEDEENTQTVSFSAGEVTDILGGIPEIQSRTEAGYVKEAAAGGRIYSGVEIRQLLGLRSAAFEVKVNGDRVYITTKGYGHGVGMSQTGAGIMAEEGSTYTDILAHYYPGTQLAKII